MPDIFLSYAREDKERARVLASALEARGWVVWWDRRIPYGKDFNAYIQQQLDSAGCIVVLWSKASLASQFVRDEATEGLNDGRLVPALIEAVKQPLGFRQLNAADLSDWHGDLRDDEFDRLVGSIGAIVPPSPAAPPVQPRPVSPATEPESAGPIPSTHAHAGAPAGTVLAQGRARDAFVMLAKRGPLVFVAIAAILVVAVTTKAALAPPTITAFVYDPDAGALKWDTQGADSVEIEPPVGATSIKGQAKVTRANTAVTYTATATAKRLMVWTVTSRPVTVVVPAASSGRSP